MTDTLSDHTTTKHLFSLGAIYATPGALESVSQDDIQAALKRHRQGDWGDVCPDDKATNDIATETGDRVLSSYRTASGVRFWIITEWDRSLTTILLPCEY